MAAVDTGLTAALTRRVVWFILPLTPAISITGQIPKWPWSAGAGVRSLADPTRRQILQDLRDGEMAAGDIASRLPIKGPSVSRHLSILKAAGLITERRDGNRILYTPAGERLALCLGGFLSAVCPEQVVQRRRTARGRS
jgi:DNA-binding transcriptional ArsR family regulator